VAQSETDAERFRALGARPVTVSGNLKVDTPVPPVDEAVLEKLSAQIGKRAVWAAISTHDGEEDIAVEVHSRLKKRYPSLLTIIVPRHPERADAMAALFAERGLSVARRSKGDAITRETDVFLGDTIGEMDSICV
jgi:3-deoxy-D-manno-octulosonic-acid transferase